MKAVYKNIIILFSIMTVIVLTEMQAYPLNIFYIDRPVLGMEFDFAYEEEVREGLFVNRADQTIDLTERLDIQTSGWIYHPALATYSLEFSPEWNQVREENSGQTLITNRSDSFIQEYDAELVLLKHKPYTLTLFAKRDNNSFRNNFTGRTIREETSYGSMLELKYITLPTTINYIHSESQSSGFFTEARKKDDVRFASDYASKLGHLRLSGVYVESDHTIFDSSVDSQQQGYTLSHGLSFLREKKARLNSSLSYNDSINGEITNREITVNQSLAWRHRRNLSTWYNFRYSNRELFDALISDARDNETVLGSFNLTHLLYENLTTNVNAGAIRIRNTGNEESKYDAGVNFHYNRGVPVGAVQVDMGQKLTVTEVSFSSDFNHVIDEPVSLVSAFTFLEKEDIDTTSIVVTDGTGTIYPEVGNYIISTIGTFTRIRCISGGQLDAALDCSAGAPVLISYDYRIKFPFDYFIHNQSYGVNLSFKDSLNMYYRFRGAEQYFIRGIRSSTDELVSEQSHLIGMSFIMKWSETNISYENKKSTTFPLERVDISEIISLQPSYYSLLRFNMGYSSTKYLNETEDRYNGKVKYEKLISGNAKFSADGFYNRITSSSQRTTDKGLLMAIDWIYRIYRGKITYSYSQLEDHIVRDVIRNKYILFSVTRELF